MIRNIYSFCPSLDFDSEENLIYSTTIRIPILQKELKEAIKKYPDFSLTHNSIKEYNNIKPNCDLKISIKKFNLGREEKERDIISKLNYYDSDIIKIAPLYYLYFKINKSSENGIPYNSLEYKLYRATGNSSKLILKDKDIGIGNDGLTEIKHKERTKQNGIQKTVLDIFIEIQF